MELVGYHMYSLHSHQISHCIDQLLIYLLSAITWVHSSSRYHHGKGCKSDRDPQHLGPKDNSNLILLRYIFSPIPQQDAHFPWSVTLMLMRLCVVFVVILDLSFLGRVLWATTHLARTRIQNFDICQILNFLVCLKLEGCRQHILLFHHYFHLLCDPR